MSDKKMSTKEYVLRVYQKRVIDPKAIAPDSSNTALERKNYYRCMKINKEHFVPQYNIGL